jgi:cytochrome c oxidase subunit 1
MLGMPRRIFTYEAGRGWELWNQIATIGALVQVPSFAIFVFNVFYSLRWGKPAGDDPWDAWTLEWATTSPPPSYNFATNDEPRPSTSCNRPHSAIDHCAGANF